MTPKQTGRPRGDASPIGPAASDFGEIIRRLRAERGETQAELAARLSESGLPMSASTVAKLERGIRPTSLDEAGLIAEAFDRPLWPLLRWDAARWDNQIIELEKSLAESRQFVKDDEEYLIRAEKVFASAERAFRAAMDARQAAIEELSGHVQEVNYLERWLHDNRDSAGFMTTYELVIPDFRDSE